MKPETNEQRKLRLLREFSEVKLPGYTADGTPDDDLFAINDMINDGWIEGHPMEHSRGWGFKVIQVIRILDAGFRVLANNKPIARATTTAKRISSATTKSIAIGITLFMAFMAWLAWRHPRQPEPIQAPQPGPAIPLSPSPQPKPQSKPTVNKALVAPVPASSTPAPIQHQ